VRTICTAAAREFKHAGDDVKAVFDGEHGDIVYAKVPNHVVSA
jgi:hypothetical protein